MTDETKDRLLQRFSQMLDASATPLVTLADLESLALTLRDQIAQATLDEAEHELREEIPESDPPHPETESPAATSSSSCSSKIVCPQCRGSAWNKGRRSRRFVTLAGAVCFSRLYFHCRRCARGFCPHDERLGVPLTTDFHTDFTPRLTHEVTCLSACLPFEQAVQTLARLTNVSVSARSAERLCVGIVGSEAEAYRAERDARCLPLAFASPSALLALPVPLPRPDVLYVGADGIQTPMKGGPWREMKIGVVRSTHRDGREAAPSRYVNLLGTAHDFGPQLESLAIDSGSLAAKKVVVLGDGAAWLWKMAATHFPTATHILDFWHALEYVGAVAREAFVQDGGVEQAKGKAWLTARAQEMKQSAWTRFYAALEAICTKVDRSDKSDKSDKADEAIAAVIRYFGNHRSRMDYATYLKEGLSIGSGLAESACKRMVTQRLKGSGMHWGEVGAQAVCALRCLLFSGEWEIFRNNPNRTFKNACYSPLS